MPGSAMPGSVIVGGAGTPIGKLSGALEAFQAVDLGGLAIKAARDKETDSYGERGASVHQGNIGSNENGERVIQEVLNQHGRLDILKVVARIPVGRL